MALWGNNDNVTSTGTVGLNYATGVVTGSGTTFVTDLAVGQVIRFGARDGIYHGDAIIKSIASGTSLTIGSTAGLSGAAIASTDFTVSECPVYTVGDSAYSEGSYGVDDTFAYGVSGAGVTAGRATAYHATHAGWVGVTTYNDLDGNLRVKQEVLVAMSGISTGNAPLFPPA
jgi:hypothetical protein